ncbi:MAG: DUF4870 domain-containing protein [Chloroflexi bacterium]|nr:MAG: DUF4870 domain-containing protein [Chloroflexota bacterium]
MDSPGDALTPPSQDERITAALAHAAIILFLLGTAVSAVIWVTQKEKSRYVAFQALQALIYQLATVLLGALGFACYFCSLIAVFIGLVATTSGVPPGGELQGTEVLPVVLLTFLPFGVLALMLIGGILLVLYGMWGGLQALQGKPFRYVFIGRRLERALQERGGVGPFTSWGGMSPGG